MNTYAWKDRYNAVAHNSNMFIQKLIDRLGLTNRDGSLIDINPPGIQIAPGSDAHLLRTFTGGHVRMPPGIPRPSSVFPQGPRF
jgi:hypothetical protein